jgi:hypothetical protein
MPRGFRPGRGALIRTNKALLRGLDKANRCVHRRAFASTVSDLYALPFGGVFVLFTADV